MMPNPQRALALGILLVTPLLAGPYFPTCVPSHGTFPMTCTQPGVGNCSTDATERFKQAEASLQEAQVTSIVSIGELFADWNALERCDSLATGEVIYQGPDPGTPNQTITCRRNLDSFREPLRQFVAAPDPEDPACDGGRIGIINLAPIFSEGSRLPQYLADARFNGSSDISQKSVLESFKDLWDAVLDELSDAAYVNDPGSPPEEPADRAHWIISIGNEIDMYLNGRRAPYPLTALPGSCGLNEPGQNDCYEAPPTRWADYAAFYTAAAAYVKEAAAGRGVPVRVGTTVRWGAELDPPPAHYSGDDVCGPRELALHNFMGTNCTYFGVPSATVYTNEMPNVLVSYVGIAAASDVYVYTRYHPRFEGEPPQPETDPVWVGFTTFFALQADFATMGTWSRDLTAFGATPFDRPAIIQEVGYPSSFEVPQSQDIADQHWRVVGAAFDAWNSYNNTIAPLENLARIQSLNWFPLHDFPPQVCGPPVSRPFQFCEWALYTSAHQEKIHPSESTSSWGQFALHGAAQNPPSTHPQRACLLE
jgi:hypothetical protein